MKHYTFIFFGFAFALHVIDTFCLDATIPQTRVLQID